MIVTFLKELVAAARSAFNIMLLPVAPLLPDSSIIIEEVDMLSSIPKMLACFPSTGFQVAALGPITEKAFMVPLISQEMILDIFTVDGGTTSWAVCAVAIMG